MYASFDESTYCTPVIMSGHVVRQFKSTYCTPVMNGKKQTKIHEDEFLCFFHSLLFL